MEASDDKKPNEPTRPVGFDVPRADLVSALRDLAAELERDGQQAADVGVTVVAIAVVQTVPCPHGGLPHQLARTMSFYGASGESDPGPIAYWVDGMDAMQALSALNADMRAFVSAEVDLMAEHLNARADA